VKLLWDSLARKRDDHEALVGDKADIVYAWCALALAAEEPFYSEDGPVNCFFTQIEAPEEKSAASPDQPTRDHVILYALVYAAYQLNGRRRPLWADFYRDYGRFFPTRSMEEVRSVWTADMYASDAEFSAKCFDQLDAYDTQEKFNWTTRVMYEMNGNPNREEAARFAVENTRVFFRDDELDAFYCMVDDLCRF
jgi:hypothetical protein